MTNRNHNQAAWKAAVPSWRFCYPRLLVFAAILLTGVVVSAAIKFIPMPALGWTLAALLAGKAIWNRVAEERAIRAALPHASLGAVRPITVADALAGDPTDPVGAAERSVVIELLASRYVEGVIEDEEHGERYTLALHAATRASLHEATRGLL